MEATPTRIGRYEIEKEIGRGMMGVVYLARDPDLGRPVALKTVRLAFAVADEERVDFEKRFMTEARAAASLSHPGIMSVYDVGRDPEHGILFIALEYLEGRPLSEVAPSGAALEWREALRLTASIAEALHHAHERGIVHRDVKPANVMVLPAGETKVMDFGVAKVAAERLTSTGQFFGTPAYMSPEQLSGEPVDGRSDLFSLGAVLYLLLTGRSPFEAESVPATLGRILYHRPPPPSSVVPGLAAAVDEVVGRALAVDRSQRYPDGKAFAAALRAAATATSVSAAPPRAARRPGTPSTRVAALGAAVTVGAIALAWILPVSLSRLPLPAVVVPPARLVIALEHPLRSGVFKVWLDGELVVEEPLESRVTRDLLVTKLRIGRESKSLEVRPGDRDIRLEVSGDGFRASRTVEGTFESGGARRLNVRVAGLVDRELAVWWSP